MGEFERTPLGDVENPGNPDGGINRKPAEGLCGLARLELKQIIHEHDRFRQVVEKIAQSAPDGVRDDVTVRHGCGPDDRAVNGLHGLECLEIELLQRIARDRARLGTDNDIGMIASMIASMIGRSARCFVVGW